MCSLFSTVISGVSVLVAVAQSLMDNPEKLRARGSFRKIVKRGGKLKVEKFGGASLVLFPVFVSSKKGRDSDRGVRMPSFAPQTQMKPLAKSSQVPSTQSRKDYMHVYTEAWQFWVLNFSNAF